MVFLSLSLFSLLCLVLFYPFFHTPFLVFFSPLSFPSFFCLLVHIYFFISFFFPLQQSLFLALFPPSFLSPHLFPLSFSLFLSSSIPFSTPSLQSVLSSLIFQLSSPLSHLLLTSLPFLPFRSHLCLPFFPRQQTYFLGPTSTKLIIILFKTQNDLFCLV